MVRLKNEVELKIDSDQLCKRTSLWSETDESDILFDDFFDLYPKEVLWTLGQHHHQIQDQDLEFVNLLIGIFKLVVGGIYCILLDNYCLCLL